MLAFNVYFFLRRRNECHAVLLNFLGFQLVSNEYLMDFYKVLLDCTWLGLVSIGVIDFR